MLLVKQWKLLRVSPPILPWNGKKSQPWHTHTPGSFEQKFKIKLQFPIVQKCVCLYFCCEFSHPWGWEDASFTRVGRVTWRCAVISLAWASGNVCWRKLSWQSVFCPAHLSVYKAKHESSSGRNQGEVTEAGRQQAQSGTLSRSCSPNLPALPSPFQAFPRPLRSPQSLLRKNRRLLCRHCPPLPFTNSPPPPFFSLPHLFAPWAFLW